MQRRAIILAIGTGGFLLVNDGHGLRPPVADLEPEDDPVERISQTLRREGFAAGLKNLGTDTGGTEMIYLARLCSVEEHNVDGWLACGGNPAEALRRFATRCPTKGRAIYEAAARLLENHLREHPLAA